MEPPFLPLLLLCLAAGCPATGREPGPPGGEAARVQHLGTDGSTVLVRSLVSDPPGAEVAVVRDVTSGALEAVLVGDELPPGRVVQITGGWVLVRGGAGARLVVPALPPTPAQAAPPGFPRELAPWLVETAPDDFTVTRARYPEGRSSLGGHDHHSVFPAFRDGRLLGLRVARVRPGSDLDLLGARRGDLVVRVNGARPAPGPLLELAEASRAEAPLEVRIDLEREGAPVTKVLRLR